LIEIDQKLTSKPLYYSSTMHANLTFLMFEAISIALKFKYTSFILLYYYEQLLNFQVKNVRECYWCECL